jgi:hypothetical protein
LDHSKLLDHSNIEVEHILVFDLLLLFGLVVLAATYSGKLIRLVAATCFHKLAFTELLLYILSVLLSKELLLEKASLLIGISLKASLFLELVAVGDQVSAIVNFFLVRVG